MILKFWIAHKIVEQKATSGLHNVLGNGILLLGFYLAEP